MPLCLNTTHLQINPNATAYGLPALHFAAKDGHLEIIRVLVDAGANVNHLGKTLIVGNSPWEMASIGQHWTMPLNTESLRL